jgi:DNA ligase D-like protein (predicted ligase)
MAMRPLPEHIEPMLARIGRPFDSPAHLFEIKWDGVRAIAYVEGGEHRMHGRRRRDLAGRYPELAFLGALPSGCVLDGELVVLQPDGRPDFRAVLARENGRAADAPSLAARLPVVYVVFDLLYARGESLLAQPLVARRARLEELVASCRNPRLVLSAGVVGDGLQLFAAARARGLEGIVAKRLEAPYLPGERTDAWQKIKLVQQIHCLVLGYEPAGGDDFKSLILATDVAGEIRCVGKVGSGIGAAERAELRRRMAAARADRPLVDPGMAGCWVAPGIYCTVSFLEWTPGGALRAPVFVGLVPEGAA